MTFGIAGAMCKRDSKQKVYPLQLKSDVPVYFSSTLTNERTYASLPRVLTSEDAVRESVKALLKTKGVSDGQFAKDMGLTKVWASKWLRKRVGSVPVKRLDALAAYFGVTPKDLLTGVQTNTPVSHSVTRADVDSAQPQHAGGKSNAASGNETRRLQQRIDELERLIHAQAIEADRLSDELWKAITDRGARRRVHGVGNGKSRTRKSSA